MDLEMEYTFCMYVPLTLLEILIPNLKEGGTTIDGTMYLPYLGI